MNTISDRARGLIENCKRLQVEVSRAHKTLHYLYACLEELIAEAAAGRYRDPPHRSPTEKFKGRAKHLLWICELYEIEHKRIMDLINDAPPQAVPDTGETP